MLVWPLPTEKVLVSTLSRSVLARDPTTSAKVLSSAVSTYEAAVTLAASVGLSFTPVISILSVYDAVAPELSVTVRVKLSLALLFKPSIALSLGTYL